MEELTCKKIPERKYPNYNIGALDDCFKCEFVKKCRKQFALKELENLGIKIDDTPKIVLGLEIFKDGWMFKTFNGSRLKYDLKEGNFKDLENMQEFVKRINKLLIEASTEEK